MKRIISVFLILAILCSSGIMVEADEINDKSENYALSESLLQYLKTDNHGLLCRNNNYGYMNFVNGVRTNEVTMYFFEMANIFAETGVEPDKEKYMEVLVNIMATYEMDNAPAIAEQQKQDNLKSAKDYAVDIAGIVSNSVSLSVDGELEEWISTAISGVDALIENTDNWIDAFSNLETIVQDYRQYDDFLKVIEQNAEGELRSAASALRTSMKRAIEIKLDTYKEISNENFQNYEELLFEDVFFAVLEQTNDYSTNPNFRFLVDCGDEVVSVFSELKSSWELGTGIGKLIGNVVVGGEDLANRTMEMRALYDISMILQKELMEVGGEFAENYLSAESDELAKEYVAYSNFLIGCRIRGEYCLYSVIASDAGLLSWANKKDAQEAAEWYKRQSGNILEIRDAVQKVMLNEKNEIVSNAYFKAIEFNAYGEKTQFTYQIPQINIETVQAQDLNLKIYNELEKYVLEAEKISSEKLDDLPECSGLSYTWGVYENILSIMIVGDMWPEFSPYTTYWVYNIDIESGEEITNDRLFKLFDLSQDEYLELAKKAMAENWWTVYGEVIEREGLFESVKQQLSDTLSEDNVNETMPYINQDGNLCAIYKMYAIAGAESYEQIINLTEALKSEFSMVNIYIEQAKALLQDNAVEQAVAVLDEGMEVCTDIVLLQKWKEYTIKNTVISKSTHYEEGIFENTSIVEYDENGNEIRRWHYDANGRLIGFAERSYDKNNNCVEWISYDESQNINFKYIFQYEGHKEKSEYYYSHGEEHLTEYIYNIYDECIKRTVVDNGDTRTYEYEYDTEGNCIKEIINDNGDIRSYEYKYDTDGKCIKEIVYLGLNEVVSSWNVLEYDENGNEVMCTTYGADGEAYSWDEHEYIYGRDGNTLKECNRYYSIRYDGWTSEATYDIFGNMLEYRYTSADYESISKYEYEYQFIGSLDNAIAFAIDVSDEKRIELANGGKTSGAAEPATEYSDSEDEELNNIPNDAMEFNGHKYYVYGNRMSWNEAKIYCEEQGGYLATITSQEEDTVLYDYITEQGYSSVYFGLTDEEAEGIWKWVTGECVDYQNWKNGEPNNEGKKEHYGMYYSKNADGTWNDGNGKSGFFICEWNVL